MDREKLEELASQVMTIFQLIMILDRDMLAESEKTFENDMYQYEALGIVNGHNYFAILDDKKARLERLRALIHLINTLEETNENIDRKGTHSILK